MPTLPNSKSRLLEIALLALSACSSGDPGSTTSAGSGGDAQSNAGLTDAESGTSVTEAESDASLTDQGSDVPLAEADGSAFSTDAGSSASPLDAESKASFTEVYSQILGPICTACHAGAGAPAGLDMSTQAKAYANLVGVRASGPACGSSGETRVVPGNAKESLLYQKVAGTPPCGSQMPLGGTPLTSAKVALIDGWITAGAPDD